MFYSESKSLLLCQVAVRKLAWDVPFWGTLKNWNKRTEIFVFWCCFNKY